MSGSGRILPVATGAPLRKWHARSPMRLHCPITCLPIPRAKARCRQPSVPAKQAIKRFQCEAQWSWGRSAHGRYALSLIGSINALPTRLGQGVLPLHSTQLRRPRRRCPDCSSLSSAMRRDIDRRSRVAARPSLEPWMRTHRREAGPEKRQALQPTRFPLRQVCAYRGPYGQPPREPRGSAFHRVLEIARTEERRPMSSRQLPRQREAVEGVPE